MAGEQGDKVLAGDAADRSRSGASACRTTWRRRWPTCLSDGAAYVTGQVLSVSGGLTDARLTHAAGARTGS